MDGRRGAKGQTVLTVQFLLLLEELALGLFLGCDLLRLQLARRLGFVLLNFSVVELALEVRAKATRARSDQCRLLLCGGGRLVPLLLPLLLRLRLLRSEVLLLAVGRVLHVGTGETWATFPSGLPTMKTRPPW